MLCCCDKRTPLEICHLTALLTNFVMYGKQQNLASKQCCQARTTDLTGMVQLFSIPRELHRCFGPVDPVNSYSESSSAISCSKT